jgi:broad specificity phosphatase PhoE
MAIAVLIRPGCTDYDEQHRIQGALDLPLNDRGQQQVDELIEQLRDQELDKIYTSVSEPARSTALAIGASLDVPVKELDDLRNFDQGLWQGLQIDDVRRKYPKVYKQWKESPESICPPQGEPVEELAARVRRALKKPLKRGIRFAVVASEPIATLVRGVIEGCQANMPGPICGDADCRHLEILHYGQNGQANGEFSALGPDAGSGSPAEGETAR